MEEWKPIPEYENMEISDIGRVRCVTGKYPGRIFKQSDVRGYKRVPLVKDGRQRTFFVHRLMWEAFVGPIPEGLQINHLNGVKDDNRIANMEVCTVQRNSWHRTHVLGKQNSPPFSKGEANGRAKLKESDIPKIFAMRETGATQQRIAETFNVDQTSISRILLKKGWNSTT